jgi:glutamyl-Q tRNA(Asp) synthetase
LQRCLGYRQPDYAHVPVVLNENGEKLSKQTGALAIDDENPLPALIAALRFLRHDPPPAAQQSLTSLWSWAIGNWDLQRLRGTLPFKHKPRL